MSMRDLEIPDDTINVYVEMDEKDIHFLSSVVKGYDGIAHVRRDWIVKDERHMVRIMVPPGFEDEITDLLERARAFMTLGKIYWER